VEDFEGGVWPATGWTAVSGASGTIVTAVHEGSYALQDVYWHYNTSVSVVTGDILGAWIYATTSSGRAYLGFDSSASGTRSFVVAPNTGDIRFQQNASYGYSELSISTYSIPTGQWLYMEVELTSTTTATGRLYDSDGTTLLDSVSHTFSTAHGGGGVAIQTFDAISVDYITLQ
jgi:hypothetical protein